MRSNGAVADRILGILGAAMVIAALVVLIRGGPTDTSAPTAPPPPIRVVQPTQGATVSGPFLIVFRVENAEMTQGADGWGLAGMHLHIEVDGTSFMPAPTDITRSSDGSYRWTFADLGQGPHDLRLYWSDMNHVALPGGGSPIVQVVGS